MSAIPLSPGSSRPLFPFWVVALPRCQEGLLLRGASPVCACRRATHRGHCTTLTWVVLSLDPWEPGTHHAGLQLPLPTWLVTSGLQPSGPFQALEAVLKDRARLGLPAGDFSPALLPPCPIHAFEASPAVSSVYCLDVWTPRCPIQALTPCSPQGVRRLEVASNVCHPGNPQLGHPDLLQVIL